MNVRKTDDFLRDIERRAEWYATRAGLEVADAYLNAIEATCQLLNGHPMLGPVCQFSHPRLHNWRFFVVHRPFNEHVVFYEILGETVILRRAMHGRRDLSRRLVEPPE